MFAYDIRKPFVKAIEKFHHVLSSLSNFYVLTNVNIQVAMIIIVLPYTRKCFLLSLKIHTYDSIIQGIASSTF